MPLNRTGSLSLLGGLCVVTLLVAAGLRLWDSPGVPPGPHYDEAANVILAAEIAGGEKMPIFIPSYTGKEVLFFYGAAGMMRLLGVGLLALRLTAVLVGLLTVAATGWLVYELFVADEPTAAPWLAVLAAALLATSFWHVLLSRLGFRAITQPLLQALTLAALWRGLRLTSLRWLAAGGVLCGLTGYTYLAARAFLLPLAVTLCALLLLERKRWRERLAQLALFGVAALLSFGPLGLYFLRHPGAFGNRIAQVGPGGNWEAAFDGVAAAFGMLFWRGDPYVRFNLPGRPLLGPVVAGLFVLGVVLTAWRLLRPQTFGRYRALARAREVLLLVWVPLMLLPTALAVGEITPSNLRAIGLIPLLFVFPARGLWRLLQPVGRGRTAGRYVPSVGAVVLLLVTGVGTARTYFYQYAPRTDLYEASDGDLADVAAYLNRADLAGTSVYVSSIHYRHPTLASTAKDYQKIKWLVGTSTLVIPASGQGLYLFPRSARPDPAWLERYLPGASPLAAPRAPDGAPAFSAFHLDDASDLITAQSRSVTGAPFETQPVLADFGGVLRLSGHQVERAVSGDGVEVTLVWRILAPPPYPDLIPFYHFTDDWGSLWGQAEPFQYAAEGWTPGEIWVSRVQVPLLPGAPPGDYWLHAGVYSRSAGQRLALIAPAGRFAGTSFPLAVPLARAEVPPAPSTLAMRSALGLKTRDGLELLGANLDTVQVRPGEHVYLTLFWRAPAGGPLADYRVNLRLGETGREQLALYNDAPVHGSYPTQQWTAGEIVVDRYDPRVPLDASDMPPGDYPLVVDVATPDGAPAIGPIALGTLTLMQSQRDYAVPEMAHPQHAELAGQIEFLGYDIDLSDARSGGSVSLVLYWRALAEMDTSYTVFTHVVGPGDEVLAQQDNLPVRGSYPTTLWLPGEVIADPYEIALPASLAASSYPIEVGFYVAENGLRLADPVVLDTVVTIER